MRNEEQIEWELTQLKGLEVSLIIPLGGSVSLSMFGELNVVDVEHHIGFHVPSVSHAVVFFVADIESLEESKNERFAKTIRLRKRA